MVVGDGSNFGTFGDVWGLFGLLDFWDFWGLFGIFWNFLEFFGIVYVRLCTRAVCTHSALGLRCHLSKKTNPSDPCPTSRVTALFAWVSSSSSSSAQHDTQPSAPVEVVAEMASQAQVRSVCRQVFGADWWQSPSKKARKCQAAYFLRAIGVSEAGVIELAVQAYTAENSSESVPDGGAAPFAQARSSENNSSESVPDGGAAPFAQARSSENNSSESVPDGGAAPFAQAFSSENGTWGPVPSDGVEAVSVVADVEVTGVVSAYDRERLARVDICDLSVGEDPRGPDPLVRDANGLRTAYDSEFIERLVGARPPLSKQPPSKRPIKRQRPIRPKHTAKVKTYKACRFPIQQHYPGGTVEDVSDGTDKLWSSWTSERTHNKTTPDLLQAVKDSMFAGSNDAWTEQKFECASNELYIEKDAWKALTPGNKALLKAQPWISHIHVTDWTNAAEID